MKTISSRGQYQDDQIACIIDSLIFGHLQRKQYSKTLHALLSESPHLTRDATTVPNAPNQIILNVNSFLHDQTLEQIIQTFYTYGRFDVSPNLLDLGKKLRDLTNEFSSELSFGCHSYSNNEQRMYGRKVRRRTQQNQPVDQMFFVNHLDASKNAEYSVQQIARPVNDIAHNDQTGLQYAHLMDSDGTRVEDSHENSHHNRRKAVRPLKQSQRVLQFVGDVVKMSNEMRDKEACIDNTSSFIDPFLDDNFDFLTSVAEGETLFETLESVEREEAMEREETDQNSRDSINRSDGPSSFALDIPMHYDLPASTSSLISPLPRHPPSTQQSHSAYTMPPPAPTHSQSNPMSRPIPRPLMEQYIEHPSTANTMDSQNASLAPFTQPPPPPPPPPPPAPLNPPTDDTQSKIVSTESDNKPLKAVDGRDCSLTMNGPPPPSIQSKSRLPLPPPPSSSSSPLPPLPPSASTALPATPKLSSLGRIPKKGQPSMHPTIPPSPSASPKASVADTPKGSDGFRMSKGKIPPVMNGSNERRDSIDSQDTLRAESVGESDCTMTENEEEPPVVKTERIKPEKKASWDDLFEDSPSTVEEANREKERHRELENKRRLEMKEMEKRRERDKRRKDKDKKDDERRDRSKDERNRYDKRSVDDRRRESSTRDERDDREKELRKRREQEEQKKIIESQKKQMDADDKARQKKKEEENRKRDLLKEKEDEKKREKEREIKKIEDEKLKHERETKAKEERRNELERRRRKEALLRKNNEKQPPLLLGDSPLDKIAAVMDGKEVKTDLETTTRTSSRVMDISSGVERNRSTSLVGSLHSSKSGIFLGKAMEMRAETTERQPQQETRRPVRPNRVQMAPMKRPPSAMVSEDESDEDEEETTQKKSKLEDNKIDHILNKIHR